MSQPNPWILFMGGLALLQVSMLARGIHVPAWAQYTGMAVCIGLGVTSIGLGLQRQFAKKPPKPRFVPKGPRKTSPPNPDKR